MSDRLDVVRDAALRLAEHYDTVQIFVSSYEPGEDGSAESYSYGVGNWFTRYGVVRNWLIREEQGTRNEAGKESDG